MAAFLEGKLTRDEVAEVSEHLRECASCRVVAAETARFDRQEESPTDLHAPARRPWWLVIAASIIIVVGAAILLRQYQRSQVPMAMLARAVPTDGRTIEARLTNFRWARLKVTRGESTSQDPTQLKFRGTAGAVIERTQNDDSPNALHAAGVAYLVTHQYDLAITALERAAAATPDEAGVWNDLAAARDAVATRQKRASELPQALADVERSLRLDSHRQEALFNRAVILEHLGLLAHAEHAWQGYLAADPSSAWAGEVRTRLKDWPSTEARGDFGERLKRASAALGGEDPGPLDALVRDYPQETRSWGEGPLLAEWSASLQRRDSAGAERNLAVVRRIAQQLERQHGEQLLADAVRIIDQSSVEGVRTLAEGHRLYDAGRKSFRMMKLADAERDLLAAAAKFGTASSPMEDVARYFAANVIFDENRIQESRELTARLIQRCDRTRHRALYAQELWQSVRVDAYRGDWTSAIQSALESLNVFETLGESNNAAFLRTILANAYDHIGDPDRAWRFLVSSMDGLSRAGSASRLQSALATAIRSCIRGRSMEGAAALANLAIADLGRNGTSNQLLADALIQRARAMAESGVDLNQALIAARQTTSTISDRAVRERAEADLSVARAIAERTANPHASLELLSSAIDFYRKNRYEPWIADALFQRGRSHASARDDQSALNDFEAAIGQLENVRATLSETVKESFFDVEPELFEEIVALRLRRGEVAAAFAAAERVRARTLRETISPAVSSPATVHDVRAALPENAALLEYAYVPDGVAIFSVTRTNVMATTVKVDHARLRRLLASFRSSIETTQDIATVRRSGSALYALLVAPARAQLAGTTDLAYVADHDLQTTPFAALWNSATGRYLVEEHSLVSLPSASFLLHRNPRPTVGIPLLVANPDADGRDPLPAAEREASAIARTYGNARLLTGPRATREAFAMGAQNANIIHYAGHARGDGDEPAALLFASATPGRGSMGIEQIRHLRFPSTELVVLAACSSDRGRTRRVEGASTLARAFLAAGVPTVVGTLWEIDDVLAAPLFTLFHRAFATGESPARALRSAQLAALRSPDPIEQHPATWAGMVVTGNGF